MNLSPCQRRQQSYSPLEAGGNILYGHRHNWLLNKDQGTESSRCNVEERGASESDPGVPRCRRNKWGVQTWGGGGFGESSKQSIVSAGQRRALSLITVAFIYPALEGLCGTAGPGQPCGGHGGAFRRERSGWDGVGSALGKGSSSSAARNSDLHTLLGTGTFCQCDGPSQAGQFLLFVLTSAKQVCVSLLSGEEL